MVRKYPFTIFNITKQWQRLQKFLKEVEKQQQQLKKQQQQLGTETNFNLVHFIKGTLCVSIPRWV